MSNDVAYPIRIYIYILTIDFFLLLSKCAVVVVKFKPPPLLIKNVTDCPQHIWLKLTVTGIFDYYLCLEVNKK